MFSNQNQLVRILCFLQEEKTEDVKEHASASSEVSVSKEDIVFNPNVFTEFKLAGSPEVFLIFCIYLLLTIYLFFQCPPSWDVAFGHYFS